MVSVILIPVFIYYGSLGIRSVGQRIVSRHDRKIVGLRKELKERLDELKKKTAFDSTKNLIDRYSTGGAKPGPDEGVQKPGPQPNALAKLKQQQLDDKNRRRTMPNFGTPGSRVPISGGSAPTSPDPASNPINPNAAPVQLPRKFGQPLGDPAQLQPPPHFALPETGVVKVAQLSGQAQAKSMAATTSRPWLDKLVDQLVGDSSGVDEKYALVCRHCYAHNGLVLFEEINDIQYTCPKCGKFNPSNRAIRAAAAAPAAQLANYDSGRAAEQSDQGESSAVGSHGEKSVMNARYTSVDGDDSASDVGTELDDSKINTRPRRSGRAAKESPVWLASAVTSDAEGHDLKPQVEDSTTDASQQPQQKQQQPQKLTPKKRKGNKSKRSQ
ncbi:hypothetical protein IWW37_004303 [Coemansia sp. RSA 2050]|nr:hypothetical protein IWW37_004303 [Coemansia sp. RSA 2050]KAJ2731705.1 hypothetical protein IW152_004352 [Coemansia sp. BCRC 34962]